MSDYEYISDTGVIIPDTSTILADIQTEYKSIFGENLVVSADTPQGVLITAQSLSRIQEVNNNAALANQINPNYAGGVFLDAVMALTGIERTESTKTLVSSVALTGVATTVIPAGSKAKTGSGDVFETLTEVTLDGDGLATVDFQAVEFGQVPCNATQLTTIVSNILGWETVNNASAGVLGKTTQSDQVAKAYRSNTLGFQGVALPVAITSSVYAVEGVTSLTFRDNDEGEPVGMLISVTSGDTLSGTIWGLTTTGDIIVDTTAMTFIESLQSLPSPNPFPIAEFATTGNITLSGTTTQAGGDWGSALSGGEIILVKDQTDPTENGVWVADAGAWTRQSYNTAASTIKGSLNGITLVKNSVWMCIDGGTDLDVASAMLENKSMGAKWNGGVSTSVVEPASGQSQTVLFDRPTDVPVLIKVFTTNGNETEIKQAILNYANGNVEGLSGFVVGEDVSTFEISGAIIKQFPQYFITKVEISYTSPISYSTDNILIALNEIAFTQDSYLSVEIV